MEDLSWIQEQERLENINQNYYREPMDKIECVFIFIDANQCIEKVIKEKLSVEPLSKPNQENTTNILNRVLKKDAIAACLEPKLESKYVLDDILLYNVTIEPNQIQMFSNSCDDSSINLYSGINVFMHESDMGLPWNCIHLDTIPRIDLKSSPYLNSCNKGDIIISPSIFIFHNVNAIYFILRERTLELFVPKSIMKSANSKGKNTKKVRILEPIELGKDKIKNKKSNRGTRKIVQ